MKVNKILNKYTKSLAFVYLFLFMMPCFSTDEGFTQVQAENCSNIKNPTVRLQCYDKLFNPNVIHKIKAKSVDKTKRVDNLGKKYISSVRTETEINYMSLIKINKNKHSRYIFYFENGQVWQQLEPAYIAKPKAFPIAANLTLGALNSYNLRIGNKTKKIKVKRVK